MNLPAVVVIVSVMLAAAGTPADLSGRVVFANLPVPGAVVTAVKGGKTLTTTTDDEGAFKLGSVEDGTWTVRVEMRGFAPITREVVVPPGGPVELTLAMQTYQEMAAMAPPPSPIVPPLGLGPQTGPGYLLPTAPDDPDIINGSAVNGAATRFAQPRAIGNNRPQLRSPYSGAFTATLGNSAWNSRPYTFGASGQPVPSYNDTNVGFMLQGPFRIPWLITYGPLMSFGYTHSVSHNATTQSAVMPTASQRAGDFSFTSTGSSVDATKTIRDPRTGLPFPGNVIPADRISPVAQALLAYYPLPNAETRIGANYQVPILSSSTRDNLTFATSKALTQRNNLGGSISWQRSVTDSVNLFGFADSTRQSSINGNLNLTRRFSTRLQGRFSYQFARASSTTAPFFAGRINVSGDAGITGNDQDPANWGPPSLSFPDVAGLSDAHDQRSIRTSHSGGTEFQVRRGTHNITFGGDARLNLVDLRSQQDPRGTLAFTGAATGSAFGDFLLGLPTTSAIAFGNPHTRLRAGSYDAYITDDWRFSAGLTLNIGARWEYEAPYTEKSGGLGNLDVAPDFSAIAPVAASSPSGPITGLSLPKSLVRPDKRGFEPRLAVSWRPVLGSSLVIKASYGLYRNLGIYQPLAILLSQQPPVSRTFSVQTSAGAPLSLASPFTASVPAASNTYAIDPSFKPGSVHSWNVTVQRDLPASLTVLAAYFGDRGRNLTQAFLPNTYPSGAANPCAASAEASASQGLCPSGFVYVTSNGTSMRNALQLTLRRRLHAGLTASVQYTLAKSTDNAATFSNGSIGASALAIAQDWRDLEAERGPSSFDQRHLVAVQFQYTSGVGVTGGTLVDSVWGTLLKDWTITAQLNRGSGLPVTPVLFKAVAGTGVVGIRPSLTGESIAPTAAGSYVNAAAFTTPAPGTWGNAGRNSIRGPSTFSLDMTIARAFRLTQRMTLEWRVSATNVLNRVTFGSIGTTLSSPQFGLPTSANSMRRLQTAFRLGF